ncbi:MAG: hypothetical protein ABEH35_08845 [Haloarculaceae archaeon]
MPVSTALIVSAVAFTLLHLGVVWHLARRRSDEGDADGIDEATGVVECPDCGAENDLGYRFCRHCVSELPGVGPMTREVPSPAGRGLF